MSTRYGGVLGPAYPLRSSGVWSLRETPGRSSEYDWPKTLSGLVNFDHHTKRIANILLSTPGGLPFDGATSPRAT
jgi:hypothetical protein